MANKNMIFPVHDLNPKCTSTNPELVIIFFHGISFGTNNEWEETWTTRPSMDGRKRDPVCWPREWLPEDLGENIRILCLSYDANLNGVHDDVTYIGKNLLHSLVLGCETSWKAPIVLVGYSFGGLILKSLVVEVHKRINQNTRGVLDAEVRKSCGNFLANLKGTVFYSVPHAGGGMDFQKYFAWQCQKINAVNRKDTENSGLWKNLQSLSRQMEQLSVDYERAVNPGHIIYAFGEGQPVDKKWGVLVPYASAQRLSNDNNYMVEDANHLTVCKPFEKEHMSYQLLKRLLKLIIDEAKEFPTQVGHLFGLDEVVAHVLRELQSTQFLAIVGMGGIGKTTLTNEVFRQSHKKYDSSCFCENVRSCSELDVLKQIAGDLVGAKDFDTTQGGRDLLTRGLRGKKVLLVLDDVDDAKQLNFLSSASNSLDRESKILVTTRNWSCVRSFEQRAKKFDLEFLEDDHAMNLFCHHAFENQPQRKATLSEVAKKVVEACRGLPLSLEVMGSYLATTERIEVWNEALRRLKEAKPLDGGVSDGKLWSTLRISFDSLHADEKRMFLDIACLFKNLFLKAKTAERIWNSPIGLQNLLNRSLVKVGELGELRMHDQLRDMGRDMGRPEGSHPGIWLWDLEMASDFLQNMQGNAEVQALICTRDRLHALEGKMTNIRLLQLYTTSNGKLPSWRGMSLRKLNWLHITDSQRRESNLKSNLNIDFTYLPSLRVCHLISVDLVDKSIGNLKQLKELSLAYCEKLENLPASIGDLIELQELGVASCGRLEALPLTICRLTQLRVLDLWYLRKLRTVPSSIGDLAALEELQLCWCPKLKKLPDSMGQLTKLRRLDLNYCQGLKELPSSIGELAALEELYLDGCEELKKLPDSMGQLTKLRRLDLSGCRGLEALPSSIGQLTKLHIVPI